MNCEDVLGLVLDEGIKVIKENFKYEVKIDETYGTNNKLNNSLTEPRIIRVNCENDVITLVVGYF